MSGLFEQFPQVWCVDFEYGAPPGAHPEIRCMVAREFHTGRLIRMWADDLKELSAPPFSTDEKSLFVAYYASAELNCFLQLGWELPVRVLDLFIEFKNHRNGLGGGAGLIHALQYFGLESIDSVEKDTMRELALRGGPYTEGETLELLDYCQSDVDALVNLLPRLLPHIDFPSAILRGRYMGAIARMEYNGVPIDTVILNRLQRHWEDIKGRLIRVIDEKYGVFEGTSFKQDLWAEFLASENIPWPRTETGRLSLSEDTFRQMSKRFPVVAPIHELRDNLGRLRLNDLAIGPDGRNRQMLSPFRSSTGRNQPSNSRFIFGPSVWFRGLIRPEQGYGLAYIDWSQQEFGIAAALSGDEQMQKAYLSGDPYLEFAKQAGAVPANATKETHKAEREQFKACVLAVQYGMGPESLARSIGQPVIIARELLRLHRETYQIFWRWSDAALDFANLFGYLPTVFGWKINVGDNANPRSLRNFPMQANGAEMLRLACIYATEAGIKVCAPVHDAVLIEAPLETLGAGIENMRVCMAKASRVVLDGFESRTGVEQRIEYPDRYSDPRGEDMWKTVMDVLEKVEAEGGR